MSRLAEAPDPLVKELAKKDLAKATRPSPKVWSRELYQTVDGSGLKDSTGSPPHAWIDSGDLTHKGGKFVNMVKLRLGVLETPARSARGRDRNANCDFSCGLPGTLHHILQVCPRTQPWRITRRNRLMHYVAKSLKNKGYNVLIEMGISTSQGLRKPDLIVWNHRGSYVLDVQVTADSNVRPLVELHNLKVSKYDHKEIKDKVKELTGHEPTVEAITFNWRGTISRSTVIVLKSLGIVKRQLNVMMTIVIEGGIVVYSNYKGMSGGVVQGEG